MPSFVFSKLIPGGNATILLPDPEFSPEQLPEISARLMDSMHLQAEQVGALYGSGQAPSSLRGTGPHLPHLQMMGGEFCVNATRSAALLLVRQGRLAALPGTSGAWGGELTVSGMDRSIPVLAALDPTVLEATVAGMPAGAEQGKSMLEPISSGLEALASRRDKSASDSVDVVRLHCAARVDCSAPGVRRLEKGPGVTLVSLPGIQHLLVDASLHPLPDLQSSAWKTVSAAWRADSGLAGSPASGVVWYERLDKGYRIWPAVEVAATGSEHLETACGSASLAMALVHLAGEDSTDQRRDEASVRAVDVFQPSGEALRVLLPSAFSGIPESAWIAGPVRLVAQGTAYF